MVKLASAEDYSADQRDILDRIGIGVVPSDPIRVDRLEWRQQNCYLTATLLDPKATLFRDWMETQGWEWQESTCSGDRTSVTWAKCRPQPLTDSAAKLRMARYTAKATAVGYDRATVALKRARDVHLEALKVMDELEAEEGSSRPDSLLTIL